MELAESRPRARHEGRQPRRPCLRPRSRRLPVPSRLPAGESEPATRPPGRPLAGEVTPQAATASLAGRGGHPPSPPRLLARAGPPASPAWARARAEPGLPMDHTGRVWAQIFLQPAKKILA
jgi:hypothetical protein